METLDITFYRDDLSTVAQKPVVQEVPSAFTVEGKTVILVDDVLYTGRTTRAAWMLCWITAGRNAWTCAS